MININTYRTLFFFSRPHSIIATLGVESFVNTFQRNENQNRFGVKGKL